MKGCYFLREYCSRLLRASSCAFDGIPGMILSDLHLEIGQQYASFTFPHSVSQTNRPASCNPGVHAREAAWLRKEVANLTAAATQQTRNLLIATHHAPCLDGTSQPEHAHNLWSSAFATEMLASGDWSPVKTWVFGHTHYSTDFVRNDIRIVANQRGYVMPLPNRYPSNGSASNYFDAGKVVTN
ncbi:hypothetical protein LMH87_001518 [Akanthomyces muscarius]|uniref:Calcineurin-like phosphoesterase domain-containing protein n=1 Tax=Akanthomyces muscarius TaxID=2231603 RepID=A0A9W8UHM6_AKAMU|nr:hypothetical protein LMH87_001518 [Akanthomyces muscarius]KAJ4146965.1 hypothetical protein LMH87_001518 [Akanthomyces muscarius]